MGYLMAMAVTVKWKCEDIVCECWASMVESNKAYVCCCGPILFVTILIFTTSVLYCGIPGIIQIAMVLPKSQSFYFRVSYYLLLSGNKCSNM